MIIVTVPNIENYNILLGITIIISNNISSSKSVFRSRYQKKKKNLPRSKSNTVGILLVC